MAQSLEYDPTNLIHIMRATFGISWDVPYDVALHWDQEYECMRALAFAKLWGRAHCFAVGDVRVELGLFFHTRVAPDGRMYVPAHTIWKGFSLSELPEGQREAAREICENLMHRLYVTFMRLEPLTVSSLGD